MWSSSDDRHLAFGMGEVVVKFLCAAWGIRNIFFAMENQDGTFEEAPLVRGQRFSIQQARKHFVDQPFIRWAEFGRRHPFVDQFLYMNQSAIEHPQHAPLGLLAEESSPK